MKPGNRSDKWSKDFHKSWNGSIDGFRFINQNRHMRRPGMFLRRHGLACFPQGSQAGILLRPAKEYSAARKHPDMTDMHRHLGKFCRCFSSDFNSCFLLIRGKCCQTDMVREPGCLSACETCFPQYLIPSSSKTVLPFFLRSFTFLPFDLSDHHIFIQKCSVLQPDRVRSHAADPESHFFI